VPLIEFADAQIDRPAMPDTGIVASGSRRHTESLDAAIVAHRSAASDPVPLALRYEPKMPQGRMSPADA
jgi:hypothetical protein